MDEAARRNRIAQWAYDTRPVLQRFHLWIEDVTVERSQEQAVSEIAFTPRGILRSLAMTAAATALGTRLFGEFGAGRGADKAAFNQAKKAADAISAYITSEGLWQLSRSLPENHAIMVSLGEGLMPKAGETPEMGANPLLGFGRVYARPEVARAVDAATRRLLNDPAPSFARFYDELDAGGITVWGAAVDTLENTTRFAEGRDTGPMTVLHLFDSPLTVSRPYEAYMGCLTVPRAVTAAAERASVLLDWVTPRRQLVEAIEAAYPGILREHVHVWTLGGRSRTRRLSRLWDEWRALGVDLVDENWRAPSGQAAFTESGTYAPTFLVGAWRDDAGRPHLFLVDGYAATAEAMQAASLSPVLDLDATMAPLSERFELPHDREYQLMRLDPDGTDFEARLGELFGETRALDGDQVAYYRGVIRQALLSNLSLGRRVLRADDFLPEKDWHVVACAGYICDDPYTGARGVTRVDDDCYDVCTRVATRDASSLITFRLRLTEGLAGSRLVFSPLLTRFLGGYDHTQRAVKVSDSGRIRNELQTLLTQALEYDGDRIRVHFDRIDDKVMPKDRQERIRAVLEWYRAEHPVWFAWLEIA